VVTGPYLYTHAPQTSGSVHPRTRWACTTVQYRVCSGAHCSVPNRQHTSGIRRTRRSLLHVSSTPTIVTDTFPPRVACALRYMHRMYGRMASSLLHSFELSQPPGRSSPSRALFHVALLVHTCHGPVDTRAIPLVPVWFTSLQTQSGKKAPPFKHLQKSSVPAERAVMTTRGFCGWDWVWD